MLLLLLVLLVLMLLVLLVLMLPTPPLLPHELPPPPSADTERRCAGPNAAFTGTGEDGARERGRREDAWYGQWTAAVAIDSGGGGGFVCGKLRLLLGHWLGRNRAASELGEMQGGSGGLSAANCCLADLNRAMAGRGAEQSRSSRTSASPTLSARSASWRIAASLRNGSWASCRRSCSAHGRH